ncbi:MULTISPECIES: hypothetical protein [Mycobacterium]|uniref:Uncharacterized protein n=2 Tax=Mycobacterium TaxID=1763 RepID=A0A1X1XY74_9MYCO|nr:MULTISPECIES: hypothetical protein [Mycobacterium]MBZ4631693.1 hypothetical protein [Mycobacterium avium subsp. hominissuis]MCV6991869.1 hypothetical protein [Mycobacterium bouchedurhonense]MCV6993690.1 hypothetical protein [Mycobacterium timonense]MDV3306801.1 hypothetical protein [Mycobacterium avium subsp. hominissuis]ORW03721.1 hypothetical protein AWC14_00325 [Mycobacterium kyorinense]
MAETVGIDQRLMAYAQRILAGTGLTVEDTTGDDAAPVGSAAEALRHGWDMARRAGKVQR